MGMEQSLEVIEGDERQVLATWRKEYHLHAIFVQVASGRRSIVVATGQPIWLPDNQWSAHCELTSDQMARVERMLRWLYPERYLAFLEEARSAASRGAKVVYTAG